MQIDFFLGTVVRKLVVSTFASLIIGGVVGVLLGLMAAAILSRKQGTSFGAASSVIKPAIAGSFIGTMLLTFLPIEANPASMVGGPYGGLWYMIQLLILGPLGSVLGALLGIGIKVKRPARASQTLGWGVIATYVIAATVIYIALSPAPVRLSTVAESTAEPLPLVAQISGYTAGNIRDLALSADGQQLAIADAETIRIWDLQTQKITRTIKLHRAASPNFLTDAAQDIAFSIDAQVLISAAPEEIKVRDLKTGEIVQRLEGGFWVWPTGDGRQLVSVSPQPPHALKVWDLQQYQHRLTVPADFAPWDSFVDPLSLSAQGSLLAVAPKAHQNLIEIWDLEAGQKRKTLGGNAQATVTALALSPDSQHLAAVYANTLYLWDLQTDQVIQTIPDVGAVKTLLFHPQQAMVIAKGDERFELWNLDTATSTLRLDHPYRSFTPFDLSRDGTTMAAYTDQQIKIWRLPE